MGSSMEALSCYGEGMEVGWGWDAREFVPLANYFE
jgi:hypothetical protein